MTEPVNVTLNLPVSQDRLEILLEPADTTNNVMQVNLEIQTAIVSTGIPASQVNSVIKMEFANTEIPAFQDKYVTLKDNAIM